MEVMEVILILSKRHAILKAIDLELDTAQQVASIEAPDAGTWFSKGKRVILRCEH